MSDTSEGPGWWVASDGKWYAPELHPDYIAPSFNAPVAPPAPTHPAATSAQMGDVRTTTSMHTDQGDQDTAIDAQPGSGSDNGVGGVSRPLLFGLLAVVAIGALAFLAFRVLSGGGSGAGASSPEEAVQGLIDSVNEADPVGLLAAFDPEEADAWVSSFSPLLSDFEYGGFDEAGSNEQMEQAYETVLSSLSLTLTGPDGADPTFEVTTLAPGHLASVRVLGLDMSFAVEADPDTTVVVGVPDEGTIGLDLSSLSNVSATVRDDGRGLQGTATNADGEVSEEYADGAHIDVVAIERDGEWYISVGYTMLELIRSQGGMNSAVLPDFGAALRAIDQQQGAATAEDAVRELFMSLETLDVNKMVGLTDPVALPYLHDYLPMIDAEISPAEQRDAAATFNLRVDELVLGASEWEGRTIVTVDRIAGGIAEGGQFTFDFDTWCGQAEAQGDEIEGCASEAIQSGLNELGDRETRPADLLPENLGFVVEERNGSWFVHPIATIGYLMDQSASSLQRFIESNADAFQDEVGTSPGAAIFAFEAPIARQGNVVSNEPTNGIAGAAMSLADFIIDIGTRDEVGVALFEVTTTSPATIASAAQSGSLNAGRQWGFAVDVRDSENFELPAVAFQTNSTISLELFDATVIQVGEAGYVGVLPADGRPLVFQAPLTPVGTPDVQLFGASYMVFPYWDDDASLLLDGEETFDWINSGDFFVVYGDPGSDFEIFVS